MLQIPVAFHQSEQLWRILVKLPNAFRMVNLGPIAGLCFMTNPLGPLLFPQFYQQKP